MSKLIMTVDDSTSVRKMVRLILEGAGFSVIEASNGMEALEKSKSSSVDLFLLDLYMPGMDGFELTQQLRQSEAYKFSPIIILSVESKPAQKEKGHSAGATGWLVKPFKPAQMLWMIRKILGPIPVEGRPAGLIEQLMLEHRKILQSMDKVVKDEGSTEEWKKAFLSFHTNLTNHLEREDNDFYPPLRDLSKADEELASLLNEFETDMAELLQFYQAKFSRLDDQTVDYARSFEEVRTVLIKRIQWEEDVIYQAFTKLVQ